MDENKKKEDILYQESLFPDEVPGEYLNESKADEDSSPEAFGKNTGKEVSPSATTDSPENHEEADLPEEKNIKDLDEGTSPEPVPDLPETLKDEDTKEKTEPSNPQSGSKNPDNQDVDDSAGSPDVSFAEMISHALPNQSQKRAGKELDIPDFFGKEEENSPSSKEESEFFDRNFSGKNAYSKDQYEGDPGEETSPEEDEDYDEEDAEDDAKFLKTMKTLGIVLGVILAAVILSALFIFARNDKPKDAVPAPTAAPAVTETSEPTALPSSTPATKADAVTLENMTGWTVQEVRTRFAKEDVQSHGITYHSRECYNPAAAGTVYSTTPNPGALKENSSVLVYISKGNYTIPDLRGSDYTSAKQISADAAGGCLALNLTYEDVDSDQDEGTIVDIVRNGSSAVGTAASNGDYVVQVAKHFSVNVPNFEGWRKSDAEVWCQDHGLIPDITGQYTSGYTDGTVISNNMATVKRGDHVSILVSFGEYEPSDYTGRNFEELRKEVSNAISSGANVTMMTTYEDSAQPAGTVISEYFEDGNLDVTISTGKDISHS